MQHEVTKKQDLLGKNGKIIEEGWARRPLWKYNRKRIHSSLIRIKEWDYYAITSLSKDYSIAITISDLGFGALYAIAYMDLKRGKFAQVDAMKFFTFHKTGFAPSSDVDNEVTVFNDKLRISMIRKGDKRHLMFASPSLVLPDGKVGLDVDVTLYQNSQKETMNIATSWKENRRAFYLNEKVNCMPVTGTIKRGQEIEVIEENDVFGVLDWGRGRWTYQNTWFWGSASGLVDGQNFGFNIGYGFSDRSPASENVLFYKEQVHKLEDVDFGIPKDKDYLKPWHMSSSDKRFEFTFTPALDRFTNTNFVIIKSVQHQVFGYFDGKAVLDDGTVLEVHHLPGFAEEVFNRW